MNALFGLISPSEVLDWFLMKVSLSCEGETERSRRTFVDKSEIDVTYFHFSTIVFKHPICFLQFQVNNGNGPFSKISFSYGVEYEKFPYDIFDQVVTENEFDVMFDATGYRVVLGNFFSRKSDLRDALLGILEKQTIIPEYVLGAELWRIIMEHGGLNNLLEIWEELYELDISYLMRLSDPFCFDE